MEMSALLARKRPRFFIAPSKRVSSRKYVWGSQYVRPSRALLLRKWSRRVTSGSTWRVGTSVIHAWKLIRVWSWRFIVAWASQCQIAAWCGKGEFSIDQNLSRRKWRPFSAVTCGATRCAAAKNLGFFGIDCGGFRDVGFRALVLVGRLSDDRAWGRREVERSAFWRRFGSLVGVGGSVVADEGDFGDGGGRA